MKKTTAPLFALILLLAAACVPGGVPPEATGSIGRPNEGRLIDGVQLPSGDEIIVLEPDKAWGTPELVQIIEMSALSMRLAYPDTVPMVVGHLSARNGGPLRPHKSHQSGRDFDVAMYAKNNKLIRGFKRMDRGALDIDKTWFFIETLLETGKIQYVLLDWKIQKMIYEEIKIAVPKQKLDVYFQYPRSRGVRKGVIRHSPGHSNHLHVRIHCPEDDRYCID